MSQWTQITGSIRIDSIVFGGVGNDEEIEKKIKERLGVIIDFESPQDMWDLPKEKTTPRGSEGGIEYQYVLNLNAHSKFSSINRGTILIKGSLRDYGGGEYAGEETENTDYKEIIDWLNRSLSGELDDFWIRQGVVEIKVDGHKDSHLVVYNRVSKTFEEITSLHVSA